MNTDDMMNGMRRNTTILTILFCCLTSWCLAEEGRFHRVPAIDGDNIHSLLKRYQLQDHKCNFQQFYKLNKLKSNARLIKEKKYYIPVQIYTYNGKSIRSTLGIKTWEQALRIKRYNELMLEKNLRRSTLVKSNILWVPYHEMNCLKGAAPIVVPKENEQALTDNNKSKSKEASGDESERQKREDQLVKIDDKILTKAKMVSGYRKFAIFGKEHALIPLKDNKLRGKIYYVVSGHGGPDVGAVGQDGSHQLCEDEYAYDVSLRLARNLLEHGALVYMITRDPDDGLRSGKYLECDYDEYCWGNYKIPRSQKSRLYQRSDAINKLFEYHKKQGIKDQNQITVVIHIDSRSVSETTDVFFYYYPGSKRGRKITRNMHKTIGQKYRKYRNNGSYKGTVTARDLHMLREPKTTSVFIELGNIRNKYDQQRFILENNRQALSNWMYEGLIR
ncbi:MAG: N-acetylmuramoyl-L-alanine amidase [Bacteroidota bacterium]